MKGSRLLSVAIRCAGVVCAVFAMRSILDSYSALHAAAGKAGAHLQGLPESMWPYIVLLAAGLLVGEAVGRFVKHRPDH